MTAIGAQFSLVPIEAIRDTELTPNEFRVLVALYSFRDKNADTCWPKQSTLAARCGMKDATQVSKLTTRLAAKGWLNKDKKRSFNGPKSYRLSIPARLLDADQFTQVGQIAQNGQSAQVEPVKSPILEDLPKLDKTAGAILDKTTKPHFGQNYQSLITDHRTDQLTDSVANATAGQPALAVDNFTFPDLALIYLNPDSEAEILNHGVPLLTRSGVELFQAKAYLKKLINDRGVGLVLDAVIIALLAMPDEPKSYLRGILNRQGSEIPKDWQPPGDVLAAMAAAGMPENIYRDARDCFVIWFRDHGVRHTDWPALFQRWCIGDWDRSEHNRQVYLNHLRRVGGGQADWQEPAGGTL